VAVLPEDDCGKYRLIRGDASVGMRSTAQHENKSCTVGECRYFDKRLHMLGRFDWQHRGHKNSKGVCREFSHRTNFSIPKKACFPARNAGKKLDEEHGRINPEKACFTCNNAGKEAN
jgi:hypothetical protein